MMSFAFELAERLEQLGLAIRNHIRASDRDPKSATMGASQGVGDTIYAIDRIVEPIVKRHLNSWPDSLKPLLLTAEGLGVDGRLRFGRQEEPLRYRLLLDPIDGTRCLMYDKRSAWFLAAVALDLGEQTSIADSIASVMVELPTSKQLLADAFIATNDGRLIAKRVRTDTGQVFPLEIAPSTAGSLQHGFAQVSNFFPGTKQLAAELMEHLVEATLGKVEPGQASVFDDQYISTGGQMVELMLGHDRFCCDLRPIFYKILSYEAGGDVIRGLECHPYDVAGSLAARNAGVVLTDGFGEPLNAPFTIADPIHWCGYANLALKEQISPIVAAWVRGKLSQQ